MTEAWWFHSRTAIHRLVCCLSQQRPMASDMESQQQRIRAVDDYRECRGLAAGFGRIVGGFGWIRRPSDAPQLSGIVSGASFAPGVPLAPGAIVSVFGYLLADGSGGASGLPLNITLQGATVVIAGEAAPLFYASSGQLNAAIPFDVTPNTSQQVLVTRDTTVSVPIPMDVAFAQPAVFLAPAVNAANQGKFSPSVRRRADKPLSWRAQFTCDSR